MSDFRGMFKKLRKAVSFKIAVLKGVLKGLREAFKNRRNIIEYQKAETAKIQEKIESLFSSGADRALYLVVGQALSVWSRMEGILVLILAVLIDVDSDRTGLILYSIVNFQVWLNIIDDIFLIDPIMIPLRPRWTKLSYELRQLKDDRDRIAHHRAVRPKGETSIDAVSLHPSPFDLRKKSRKLKPMTDDDILEFSQKVAEIAEKLGDLVSAMVALRRASLNKPAEQLPDPPQADAQ